MPNRNQREARYRRLVSYREELQDLVRERAYMGVGEEEMTEEEFEVRRRLGEQTSCLVDGEEEVELVESENDFGWDEEDERLITVNITPVADPPRNNRGEESTAELRHEVEDDEHDFFMGEFAILDDDVNFGRVFEMDIEDQLEVEELVGGWPILDMEEIEKGGSMCPYCQEDIEVTAEAIKMPYCPHIYHKKCAILWLTKRSDGTKHKSCTICRKSAYTPPSSPTA